MGAPRMMVIGLDCAPPELVFTRYRDVMPNLSGMMDRGRFGPLRSSEPPITVPAWTCMVSGRDPGELGLYGFRNRIEGSTELRLATSEDVRVKRVWDWLGEQGYRVAPLFVPLTSPPTPVRGQMVSGFMHPGGEAPWCFPEGLAGELEERFGPYIPDVEDFRSDDLGRIYREITQMVDQHFAVARWIWEAKSPDFLMMVEIGVDRFHHAFWRHIDPEHPRHEPGNRYANLGRDFYAAIDRQLGRLCALADQETTIMVVSDHGARAMHGGFCINEWLIRRGYLKLVGDPPGPIPLSEARIDWARTKAWAEGGYYGRVFFNVAGREPSGIVDPSDLGPLRAQLSAELEALRDEDGAAVAARVRDPLSTYRQVRGFPPDLMVYFDDLRLRAIGSVGSERLVVQDNDTGPDGCNHAWDGIYIEVGPDRGTSQPRALEEITRTILQSFDIATHGL